MDACVITPIMEDLIESQLIASEGTSVYYDFFMKGDVSHIIQYSGNISTNWFFSKYYGEKSPSSLTWTNSFLFKVEEEIMVPFVTSMMKSILSMYPGKMRFISIGAEALSSEVNKEFLFSFIETVKTCKHLYIDGRGTDFLDSYSQLLNNVAVTDKISTREFPVDNRLNFKKISETDTVHLDMLSPSPQNILDAAAKFSVFTVDRFGIEDINTLITLWASSDIGHIISLNIRIERPETARIEKLFKGFTLIGGKDKSCCKFLSTCKSALCEYSKAYKIENGGIEIVRSDGAKSIIAYSSSACDISFVMICVVRKPKNQTEAIRKAIRTTIHDQCETHTKEMDALQFIYENNESCLSAIHKEIVVDWIAQENEREWDAYHETQHHMYQQYTNQPIACKTEERYKRGYLKLTDSSEKN